MEIFKLVGSIIVEDSQARQAIKEVKSEASGISGVFKRAGGAVGGFIGTVGKIAGVVGVFKLVDGAVNMITNSFDGAISRVDTLNQFPRVLEQMGVSGEDAEASIARLSEGIQGLPTTLDGIAGSTQRMFTILGDIDLATESTLALNNAFLASGASQADANRGMEQYMQMLSSGKVDMQSWRTLQETMPYALNETAEAFGFTGESATNDFYDALLAGEITMEDFNAKMIELSEGQGGFAEMALEGSRGIATSWQNIQTAVTTGVANVISAFDDWLEAEGFGGIAGVLDGIKESVQETFSNFVEWIPTLIESVVGFYDTISETVAWEIITGALENLVEAIKGIDLAEIITQVGDFLEKWEPLILGIIGAVTAFKVLSTVIPLVISAFGALKTAFGFIKLITSFKDAITLLGMAIPLLTSPLLWVSVAIGAVIAIGVLLYKNWDTVKEKAIELGAKIGEVWENIKTSISNAWESIKTSVSEGVSNIWNSITTTFSNIITSVTTWGSNMVTSARTTASNFLTAVVEFFQQLPSRIQEWLTNAVNRVAEWGGSLASKGRQAISELISAVVEKATSLPEKMLSIGSDMVKGLWNGINSVKDWILGKIGGFVDSITGGIKDFFGIASPSKLMADEVGKWIPAGIAVGIEDNSDLPLDALNKVIGVEGYDMSGTVRRMNGNRDGENRRFGGDVKQNITIHSPRPLDPIESARQIKKASRQLALEH